MNAGEQTRTASGEEGPQVPVIRVERGNPTPEQLAALTVVLTAATSGASPEQRAPRRTPWTARPRCDRLGPVVGPGGWRASALPR